MIVFIVGAGGHGQDVADIARACGHDPRFLDDRDLPGVIGRPCEVRSRHLPYVVAVNDPQSRARLAVGGRPVTLVHPTAVVSDTAQLSAGVVVGASSTVGPWSSVGAHSHIGAGCTLTRTHLGRFCAVAPGVDMAGDVTVGDRTLIGVGARVANLRSVGRDCVVGAGAVVVDDVPDGTTVVGVPARPIGALV